MKIVQQKTTGLVTKGILQDEATGQQIPFAVLNEKHQFSIWFNCQIITQGKQDTRIKTSKPGSNHLQDIIAPMPGRIIKILVENGQVLEAGEAVVIMESMKMELSLTAEIACIAEGIYCKSDDKVDMNQLLVKLKALTK